MDVDTILQYVIIFGMWALFGFGFGVGLHLSSVLANAAKRSFDFLVEVIQDILNL